MTSEVDKDKATVEIAPHTRHKSLSALQGYVRNRDQWKRSPLAWGSDKSAKDDEIANAVMVEHRRSLLEARARSGRHYGQCPSTKGRRRVSGMSQIWTKQRCAEEAAKYTSTVEFARGSRPAYHATIRYGWFDDICQHMSRARTPSRLISKELCAREARKYAARVAFQKGAKRFYIAARRRGWHDEICSHMDNLRNPSNEITLERCAAEARKYETRTDFAKGSAGFYIKARRMGWLNQICEHMEVVYQTWTKKMSSDEAAKCVSRSEFFRKSPKAYKAALTNGWLDDICTHMVFLRSPEGYWTKERCGDVARQFSVRK